MALILIWNFQEENKTNKTYINVIQLKIILQWRKKNAIYSSLKPVKTNKEQLQNNFDYAQNNG